METRGFWFPEAVGNVEKTDTFASIFGIFFMTLRGFPVIQPVPHSNDSPKSSPKGPKSPPPSDSLLDREGEFDKAIENIAVQLAKDFWSDQDTKKK